MLKHKDATLEAIDQLIEYYEQFEPGLRPPCTFPCPLCELHRPYVDIPADCPTCPWSLYEKHIPLVGTLCVAHRFTDRTTAERLERLERWRGLILNDTGDSHAG